MSDYAKMAYRRGCRHFTGLSNDACEKGIAYRPLMPELPCLTNQGGEYNWRCPLFQFWTAEETEQDERQRATALTAFQDKLDHHICPTCGASTLPERQVGRCVYGACGHRQYQGRLHIVAVHEKDKAE
jgi:rubredoxin